MRAISPVVVLLLNFNKHNVMDPLSQNVFNFIVLLVSVVPTASGVSDPRPQL
jgi:hypothetical protein